MLERIIARLNEALPGAVLASEERPDDDRVTVNAEALRAVCRLLKDEPEFDFKLLVDLTAVDYLGREQRFEVVYQLYSLTHKARLRVKAPLAEGAAIDSVCTVWRGADPLEREVWDMFGIVFTDHPNLKRLLMYEGFEGHPLRKDYPLKKAQPLVPLRHPLVVKDDPPYQWTRFDHAARSGMTDSKDALGHDGIGGRLKHE